MMVLVLLYWGEIFRRACGIMFGFMVMELLVVRRLLVVLLTERCILFVVVMKL